MSSRLLTKIMTYYYYLTLSHHDIFLNIRYKGVDPPSHGEGVCKNNKMPTSLSQVNEIGLHGNMICSLANIGINKHQRNIFRCTDLYTNCLVIDAAVVASVARC